MRRTFRGSLVLSILFLSACALGGKRTTGTPDSALDGEAIRNASRPAIPETEVSSEDVERNIEQPYQSAYGEIPLDYNEHVEKWVRYFQGRGRPYMETYLSRSTRYLPMMKNVLRENGLPEDLVYIALIESGFSPRAHSHANAVGYWQFIRSTGKRFGMRIDTFTDERRDPVIATRAAAEYFKALYNLLGSWHLSMSAYNVGEGRVKRAVARYRTKDFWQLIRHRRALPAETRNYVPKFIAAALIAKNPEKYGFSGIQYQDPLSYDTVALTSPISLSKLAANINVDLEEMKLLNPKFRTDFVPVNGSETVVRIPVGRATDALAALSMSVMSQPKVVQAEYYFYRVRRGDNLSTIARRHRTTVSQLRRLNGLSNRTLLSIGRRLKVPDPGGDGVQFVTGDEDAAANEGPRRATASSSSASPTRASASSDATFHIVRRGENLSTIARRYRVNLSDLMKLNNLSRRSVIRKGQKLRVRPDSPPSSSARGQAKRRPAVLAEFKSGSGSKSKASRMHASNERVAASSSKSKSKAQAGSNVRKHIVRRGETLYEVSRKYGVTLNQLANANNVKVNYRVMAGEKLLIP